MGCIGNCMQGRKSCSYPLICAEETDGVEELIYLVIFLVSFIMLLFAILILL